MTRTQSYYYMDYWVDNTASNPIPFSAWALWCAKHRSFVREHGTLSRLPVLQFCSELAASRYFKHVQIVKDWQIVQVRPPWWEVRGTLWHNSLPIGDHRLVAVNTNASHWMAANKAARNDYHERMRLPSKEAAKAILVRLTTGTALVTDDPHSGVCSVDKPAYVMCYSAEMLRPKEVQQATPTRARCIDLTTGDE